MPIHDWTRVTDGIFHHFHHEWISSISRHLNATVLPNEFYALAEQITGGFGPDVLTLGGPTDHSGNGTGRSHGGGVAVAECPPQVRFQTEGSPLPQLDRITIRHTSGDEVVAVIEVVSPGNKSSKRRFDAFVSKAFELSSQHIHLLLLDLFPPTPRDPRGIHPEIWAAMAGDDSDDFQLPPEQQLTLAAYDCDVEIQAYVEPVGCGGELPDMPLFLTHRRYVNVPLAESYANAFDAVPERWRAELT